MRRLEGRIALVTGAGAGIGRGVAQIFAREGAHVVVADIDAGAAGQVAAEIVKSNGAAEAHAVDVTDTAQVKKLMQAIGERHGKLDVLVNNAGVGERCDFPTFATCQNYIVGQSRSFCVQNQWQAGNWGVRDSATEEQVLRLATRYTASVAEVRKEPTMVEA